MHFCCKFTRGECLPRARAEVLNSTKECIASHFCEIRLKRVGFVYDISAVAMEITTCGSDTSANEACGCGSS